MAGRAIAGRAANVRPYRRAGQWVPGLAFELHGGQRAGVDIAVCVEPSIPKLQRALLGLELRGRIPDLLGHPVDIEVVILNDAPPALAWDVVCAPVVLYEADADAAPDLAARPLHYIRFVRLAPPPSHLPPKRVG